MIISVPDPYVPGNILFLFSVIFKLSPFFFCACVSFIFVFFIFVRFTVYIFHSITCSEGVQNRRRDKRNKKSRPRFSSLLIILLEAYCCISVFRDFCRWCCSGGEGTDASEGEPGAIHGGHQLRVELGSDRGALRPVQGAGVPPVAKCGVER